MRLVPPGLACWRNRLFLQLGDKATGSTRSIEANA
jgi:hypothetical protein